MTPMAIPIDRKNIQSRRSNISLAHVAAARNEVLLYA